MTKQFMNGYALLIGVNENQVNGWALDDVIKDVVALEKVLTDPDRCAYSANHVKSITGQAATRQGILDGVEWLQKQIEGDVSGNATAVVYYTGHGMCDARADLPEYYLIPYDVKRERVKTSALRVADFAADINILNPRRLLVMLDCCHAGGMDIKDVSSKTTDYLSAAIPTQLFMEEKNISTSKNAKDLELLTHGSGRAVLSSSKGEQSSYIRSDRKMSIFTYHLIEALTGHAEPKEGATEVLVSDVMSHVWRCVSKSAKADWNREQEPDYRVSGNFPIAVLLGGKGLGKGEPAPDPLASVEDKEPVSSGRSDIIYGTKVGGDNFGGKQTNIGTISGSTVNIEG
jgi:uncharacterized caspase-like protein